ncbi:MAG TPA: hypothetical protein VMV61_01370 [Patescibacteria group bacterium]|nr:hypothetical protein [Patescibacteria group bacterium]
MQAPNFIPTADPNPLPAPYWVLKLLLIVTFYLHILAMNFLMGGAVMALVGRWRSGNRAFAIRSFFDVGRKLPSLVAATITLGIAPLLFLQVIYGQYFYTSSIVMGWPWLLLLAMLTFAYYGFYLAASQDEGNFGRAGWILSVSLLLIFSIGFLFTNNLMLSQTPSKWAAKYFHDPRGWNLNLSEPTLVPRYLHFFTAAVAVGGLFLVLIALKRWKEETEYARYIFRFGGNAFRYATMAQFLVGTWFLVSLPKDKRMLFLGDNTLATALLMLGIAGALAAIVAVGKALEKDNVRLGAYAGSGLTAFVILCMSVMRDILRDAYLQTYFHPEEFAVKTQWNVFPMFLALFIAGVIFWLVMMKRYWFVRGAEGSGAK